MLAAEQVSHSSIKGYLSALRHLQIYRLGYDPNIGDMAGLHSVLQGIKRSQAISGRGSSTRTRLPVTASIMRSLKRSQAISGRGSSTRTRLPVTASIMRSLKHCWEAGGASFDKAMLWATACACFFGFLRSGEATVPSSSAYDPAVHLSITDVSIDSGTAPTKVLLNIKASKTDPFRKGVTVWLGRTNRDICPVAAIISYIATRGLSPGPLFRFKDGTPLTRPRLVRELRAALSSEGIDASKYAGHRFRIGAATTAAAVGVEDSLIKILGRWQSAAYSQYVRIPPDDLADISARLVSR